MEKVTNNGNQPINLKNNKNIMLNKNQNNNKEVK